jgi:hypothetical protein
MATRADITTCKVMLPGYAQPFFDRILSLFEIETLNEYDRLIDQAMLDRACLKSLKFHCITFFRKDSYSKYSVLALPDDLEDGPVYHINSTNPNKELRDRIILYLVEHPELGITIDDFA